MTELKVGFCPKDAKNFTQLPEITLQSDIDKNAESIKSKYGTDIFSSGGVCTKLDKTDNGGYKYGYYIDPSKVKKSDVPEAKAPTDTKVADEATQTAAAPDATVTTNEEGALTTAWNATGNFISDHWGVLVAGSLGLLFVGGIVSLVKKMYKDANTDPNAPKPVKKPEPEVVKKASKKDLERAQDALKEGKLPPYDLLIKLLDGKESQAGKKSKAPLDAADIAKRDQTRFNALNGILSNNPKTEALAEALLEKMHEIAAQPPQNGKSAETVMMEALRSLLVANSADAADIIKDLPAKIDAVKNIAATQLIDVANTTKLKLPGSFNELKTKAKIDGTETFDKQYEKIKLSFRGNKEVSALLEKQETYLRKNIKEIGVSFNVERALIKSLEASLNGDQAHFEETLEFEVRTQHLAALDSKRLTPDILQNKTDELRRQREEIERRRAEIEAERVRRAVP